MKACLNVSRNVMYLRRKRCYNSVSIYRHDFQGHFGPLKAKYALGKFKENFGRRLAEISIDSLQHQKYISVFSLTYQQQALGG
jgi:hypothetical protein